MRGGFSLLEVLLASAVLSIAFLPIIGSLHSLFRVAHHAQEATHGTFLIRATLEHLRQRARDGRVPFAALARPEQPVTPDESPIKGAKLKVTVEVEGRDTCEVHVEVAWDEGGRERRQEAWTVLTRHDLELRR